MLLPTQTLFSTGKDSKLRLGIIGVGFRGQGHLTLALQRNDIEVIALCDVQQRMIAHLAECDADYGRRVAEGLAAAAPGSATSNETHATPHAAAGAVR